MIWTLLMWILAIGIVVAAALYLTRLPPLEPRTISHYIRDTQDTALGRGVARAGAGHDDLSGIHLLAHGMEAYAARALLIRAAERSLDVQYYIWHNDLSGTLLLEELIEAADRGVRIRLLLDDNGIAGMDDVLAAMNLHPNIEIRLFNPFVIRRPKMLGYVTDFLRLNHRMHNKSLIADNQIAIIGGRNIGDEYFAARQNGVFADLDAMAIGPVVDEVSSDFDSYWACDSAYPAERILKTPLPSVMTKFRQRIPSIQSNPKARDYMAATRQTRFVNAVLNGTLDFEWAPVRMITDDPSKAKGRAKGKHLLMNEIKEVLGDPETELRLISGYFVPTAQGVQAFVEDANAGKDIAVFTNAFESTDVWIVHAGYAPYRRRLLESGVRLFEMRSTDGPRRKRRKLMVAGSGSGKRSNEGPVLRSSATMLHAKTFAVDRQKLFIGSFNFDPRSMHLNTEQGFVIFSSQLASELSEAFDSVVPETAYEVVIGSDGRLNWIEDDDGERVVHRVEPGTSAFQRAGIALLSRLPIEWLL